MLRPFGQQFKDNGYQMGNDRDAPIFLQAAYWPSPSALRQFGTGRAAMALPSLAPLPGNLQRQKRKSAPRVLIGAVWIFTLLICIAITWMTYKKRNQFSEYDSPDPAELDRPE